MNNDSHADREIVCGPARELNWVERPGDPLCGPVTGKHRIWVQPLDGSAPKQLTHWNPNPIFSFGWSPDGKWLAYASGTLTSDVVLISSLAR